MVSIVIDEIAEDAGGGTVFPIVRTQPQTARATRAGRQTQWKVWVVDVSDFTVISEVTTAVPKTVTWPGKNQPVEVTLDVSIDDPTVDDFDPEAVSNRELFVYRNDRLLAQVKPISMRADSKGRVWKIVGKDPLWYLFKRNIGRANRINYLVDPQFETSGGWTDSGVTFTRETGDANTGTKYAKIIGTGAGGYITQAVVMRAGEIGLNVYVSVWARIWTLNTPGAFRNYITLARRGQTGNRSSDRVILEPDDLPRRSWERYDLLVHIPPNRTETIDLTLWVGDGENHFDTCQMVVAESIDYSTNGPYDQAKIAAGLVSYAQGRGWGLAFPSGKSDLNIKTSFATTGVKRSRVYQLADHQPIFQGGSGQGALDEFIGADDGFDVRLEITSTSRTLKSYHPKYQPTKDDLPLVWLYYPTTEAHPDEEARCVSEGIAESDGGPAWDYGKSIEETANQVVMLGGWGTSGDQFATREEGGYSNPSTLGGLTLEAVETAPDGAPVSVLQSLANGIGKRRERPITTPVFYIVDPRDEVTGEPIRSYIGNVFPGDRLPTWVRDGTVRMGGEGEYAIVASATLDCELDRLAVTMNEDDA